MGVFELTNRLGTCAPERHCDHRDVLGNAGRAFNHRGQRNEVSTHFRNAKFGLSHVNQHVVFAAVTPSLELVNVDGVNGPFLRCRNPDATELVVSMSSVWVGFSPLGVARILRTFIVRVVKPVASNRNRRRSRCRPRR